MTGKEKELLKEMLNTVERIKDQTDYIDNHERIPQLELDAIVARVEKLYQLSVALKYFHAHADEIITESKISNADVEKSLNNDSELTGKEDLDQSISNELEIEQKLVIEPEIAEKLSESRTPHEKFVSKEDESVASKLMLQPISDLKSAIGINDKFQFINELFEGNSDQFNHYLELINNSSDKQNAESHLARLNLDPENEVVQTFLNLVERRFL